MDDDLDIASLPEMQEAVLDPRTLSALFADLDALARVEEVIVRGHADTMSEITDWTLSEARRALLARQVAAVQIRYWLDDTPYSDTLLQRPTGIRLVRCALPQPKAP